MSNFFYTKEVLKSQDGKEVPLTLEPGGPVIGKAVMQYDSESGALFAEITVENPEVAEFLRGPNPLVGMSLPNIFQKHKESK